MSSPDARRGAAAPRIFLSYPHTDAEAATRFAGALEAYGFGVWRDAAEIRTGDRYTARIEAGLGASQALVAWFSADYPGSSYCMYELKAAWLRAQVLGGDPLRRIVIVNPERTALHIWPGEVSETQFLPVSRDRPPGEEELAALWERVSTLPGTFADAGPLPMPRIRPRNRERYGEFVGREAELWRMHRALNPHPDEPERVRAP